MDNVIQVCGSYPDSYKKLKINNTENIIFNNDPSFDQIPLWDFMGNNIVVNSFLECEHYVVGGWYSSIEEVNEFKYQILIIGLLVCFSVIKKYLSYKNVPT